MSDRRHLVGIRRFRRRLPSGSPLSLVFWTEERKKVAKGLKFCVEFIFATGSAIFGRNSPIPMPTAPILPAASPQRTAKPFPDAEKHLIDNFLRRFHFWHAICILQPESAASDADTDIFGNAAGCRRHLRCEVKSCPRPPKGSVQKHFCAENSFRRRIGNIASEQPVPTPISVRISAEPCILDGGT